MTHESRAIAGDEENRQRLEPGMLYAIELLETAHAESWSYHAAGITVAITELRLALAIL